MSTLWWVRHGPTHRREMIGWTDAPADLSDHAALARLADFLPRNAVVVSSDLSRAIATADAIVRGRSRLPHEADLRELHFGDWEERTFDELAETEPELSRKFLDHPGDIHPPGGESWNMLRSRVDAAADRLADAGDNIVVVAHFGTILTQIQRAMGWTAAQAMQTKVDTLSVTWLHRSGNNWLAEGINHCP